nr:FAD-dependent oxidoreductase [Actinomyces oris]
MYVRPSMLVIGGGITGLAAAWKLNSLGCDVKVWEASSRVGGQVVTADVDGQKFDTGASKVPVIPGPLFDLIEKLGLTHELSEVKPDELKIHRDERVLQLPKGLTPQGLTSFSSALFSPVLSWPLKLRAAQEPLHVRRPTGYDISVADFISQRFGFRLCDQLIAPVTWGILGSDPSEQSLECFSTSMARLRRENKSILLDSLVNRKSRTVSMVKMNGGWSRLIDRLLVDVEVEVCKRVDRLTLTSDNQIVVREADEEVTVNGIVFAAPDSEAVQLFAGIVRNNDVLESSLGRNHDTVLSIFEIEGDLVDRFGIDYILQDHIHNNVIRLANVLGLTRDRRYSLLRVVGICESNSTPSSVDEVIERMEKYAERLTGKFARLVDFTHLPMSVVNENVGHRNKVQQLRSILPANVVVAGSYFDGGGLNSSVASAWKAAAQLYSVI